MRIIDIITMGLRSLFRRKMRTMLTVMGVVVGSAAIVVMVSLVVGMNISLDKTIEQMGDLTLITIQSEVWKPNDEGVYDVTTNKLDDALVQNIRDMEGVLAVSPVIQQWQYQFQFTAGQRYKYQWPSVMGIDPAILPYLNIEVASGELPSEGDKNFVIFSSETPYQFRDPNKVVRNWQREYYNADGTRKPPKVDVLTADLKMLVYSYEWDPSTGQQVDNSRKFTKIPLNTVGVMSDTNNNEYQWYDIVSIEAVKELIAEQEKLNKVAAENSILGTYNQVIVKAVDMAAADKVQLALMDMGYSIDSLSDTRKAMQENQASIQYVLLGVGMMSLFVAAISIANTMIMSIYERTREIGVMKVLGCKIANIKTMFLFEAAMIGFIGGILGVGLSFGLSYAFNNIEGLSQALGSDMIQGVETQLSVIPLWLVAAAIAFSTLIGLISGYIPAMRATKISALEAIKNEG